MYAPPLVASAFIAADLRTQLTTLLDVAALAILFAGILVVARYRTALAVQKTTADAWRDERDAAVARAERLLIEIADQKAKIAVLSARPDIEMLHRLMIDHDARMTEFVPKIVAALEETSASMHSIAERMAA